MRQLNTAGSPVKFTKPILPPADLLPQISETSATGWFSWFDFTINFVTVKTIFAGVQIHCDVNQRIVFTSIPIEAIFFENNDCGSKYFNLSRLWPKHL